jgi:hypothetical protein
LFEFKNDQTRVAWVYNSLHPRLILKGGAKIYSPITSVIADGVLQLQFCLPWAEVSSLSSELKAAFGPRLFKVVARPVVWKSELVNYQNKTIKQGVMATIFLLKQADPDWLVVRRTAWLENQQGLPRIEVEVHNFSGSSHPGIALRMVASHYLGCGTAPIEPVRTEKVRITLAVDKSKLKVASEDPGFRELIVRQAKLVTRPCVLSELQFELGRTGPLAGSEDLRIRYHFDRPLPPSFMVFRGQMTIEVKGDRVFPLSLLLD